MSKWRSCGTQVVFSCPVHEHAVPVQAVNFNSYEQNVTVVISDDSPIRFEDSAVLHHVSGPHGEAENSFEQPDNVTF